MKDYDKNNSHLSLFLFLHYLQIEYFLFLRLDDINIYYIFYIYLETKFHYYNELKFYLIG